MSCTPFNIHSPGSAHMEDELFIVTSPDHCLPGFCQLIVFVGGLAISTGLAVACLFTFVHNIRVYRGKLTPAGLAVLLYGLGMLFRMGTYITGLVHYTGVIRYLTGSLTICLGLAACCCVVYQWIELVLNIEFLHSVARDIEGALKIFKRWAIAFNILGSALTVTFWVGAGVYRENGDVEMTNFFVALSFAALALVGVFVMVTFIMVLLRLRRIFSRPQVDANKEIHMAIRRIYYYGGGMILIAVNIMLFSIGILTWYLVTRDSGGMAGFFYALVVILVISEFAPAFLVFKLTSFQTSSVRRQASPEPSKSKELFLTTDLSL